MNYLLFIWGIFFFLWLFFVGVYVSYYMRKQGIFIEQIITNYTNPHPNTDADRKLVEIISPSFKNERNKASKFYPTYL